MGSASASPSVRSSAAPQPGFEPGTLRLTGGTRSVSRPLRRCAGRCRIAHHPRRVRQCSTFALCRPLRPFAVPCCFQRARKGQRLKGFSRRCRSSIGEGQAGTRRRPEDSSRGTLAVDCVVVRSCRPGCWTCDARGRLTIYVVQNPDAAGQLGDVEEQSIAGHSQLQRSHAGENHLTGAFKRRDTKGLAHPRPVRRINRIPQTFRNPPRSETK